MSDADPGALCANPSCGHPRFSWDEPPDFTCDGCGAKVQGALGAGDMFGNGTGSVLPVGWMRGFDRSAKKVVYACSEACRIAVTVEAGA